MKLLFILLILSVLFHTSFSWFWQKSTKSYTPEQLAKWALDQTYEFEPVKFVDPEQYIESSQKIYHFMNQIKSSSSFETQFYVIPQIDSKYKLWLEKDIELFVNDLSYLMLKGDQEKDKNSIFILFSINDRQMRIRTGENVRKVVPDNKCVLYLDELKTSLKKGNYQKAFENLLERIFNKIVVGDSYLSDIWEEYRFWILLFFFLLLLVILRNLGDKTTIDAKDEQKLNKMKEILKSKKSRKQIICETCIICLETLEEEKIIKEEIKSTDQNQDYEITIGKNLKSTLEKEEETLLKFSKVEEVKGVSSTSSSCQINIVDQDDQKAVLECGHSFHMSCITSWMQKKSECPICREKIDKSDTPVNSKEFQNALTSIQTIYHPSFSRLSFTYIGDELRWQSRAISPTRTRSSYSRSWGGFSGGGSSRW